MTRRADRYLCPICLDLQEIRKSEPGASLIELECGHQRPHALLPSNGVSLEQLDEPIGRRLFPVTKDAEPVDTVKDTDVAIAEGAEDEDEDEEEAA